MSNNKLSFLDMPAPAGYVPGLGRGATGFTTRSDIGPARAAPGNEGATESEKKEGEEDDEERFKDPENDTGLFANADFDADDEEAERIYNAIDERMAERRKAQREAREKAEQEKFEKENPQIKSQFADLKRNLESVSTEEWLNLPEVGDLTRRRKRQRKEANAENRFYAVPDTVLSGVRTAGTVENSIDSAAAADGAATDFRAISMAKDRMLGMKLDQLNTKETAATGNGGNSVDPNGYLTSVANGPANGALADVGDIRRVRHLLENMVKSKPKEPGAWITLARLEEYAQKKVRARNVIKEGCEKCPKNEDVWLENMRLNEKHNAKIIAAEAVQFNPKSVNIWVAAADLEDDVVSKIRVVQKALETNTQSDTLWKKLVGLQSDEKKARQYLASAVEHVPLSEELWLTLAQLETAANARKVLNRARKALRVSRAVWIAAARLEEQDKEKAEDVDKIMSKGVRELEKQGGLPDRSQWIEDAEQCEQNGAILTCHAIIKATLGQGVEEEDRKAAWMEDAQAVINRKSYETARAIYAYALHHFPQSKSLWLATVQLERNHGQSKEALWQVLDKVVRACPTTEEFWLMYSREKSSIGDISGAQEVLARAFESNPNSENIWIAAVNLEAQSGKFDMASKLLQRARKEAGTERVWMKSVLFERQRDNLDDALKLIEEGLKRFPQAAKIHMQKGQIYEALNDRPNAVAAYNTGTKACPQSVPLWILYASLEARNGVFIKARTLLERAALVNEKNERLWLERVRLELQAGDTTQANALLARALQDCPNSGILWSEKIWMQPLHKRNHQIKEAVAACHTDPHLLITVARYFWKNKPEKAETWLQRAIKANPDIGDAWIWYYKFKKERSEETEPIINQFKIAEPKHGLIWPTFVKDLKNFNRPFDQILIHAADNIESSH
jgi:pre-mRNA-processing factor 6